LRRSKQAESRNKIPQTFFIHEKAPKAAWRKKKTPTICGYNEWVCAAAPALPATSNKVRYTQGPYHEFNINN
jgi:hypothetical protein